MVRWLVLLLVMTPVLVGPSASAAPNAAAGFGSFDSAPICSVQTAMAADVTYVRWPEHEDGYLQMALADPYCPVIYLQQPLVFHGWLQESGGCLAAGGVLATEATLCLSDPILVDLVFQRFEAILCVDPVSEPWCTEGVVFLLIA